MKLPSADDGFPASAAPSRWKRWRLPRILGIAATLLWAFATGAGIERIWRYEATPGFAASSQRVWPGSTLISPQPGHATLVMFVHPRCPCSRASLAELRETMTRAGGALSAWVLLLQPQDTTDEWERTPTWKAARDIPGVTVLTDHDGLEAARFGAATSGHAVLYGADGRLLFSGGITAARGHVGDNAGRKSVLRLVQGGNASLHQHPVYGCGMRDRAPQGGV